MLAYSPLHALLLDKVQRPLVMTCANLSDDPISYLQDDALRRMLGIADAAILHERKIHIFADDSIVKVIKEVPRVWRRARGYVPEPIYVSRGFKRQVLAFVPQMKNTFCFGREKAALLSQHLGDLDSEAAVNAQQAALDHFLKPYDMNVGLVACDLYPDYTSTRLAEGWAAKHNLPLVRVQHHHAHLSLIPMPGGERALKEPWRMAVSWLSRIFGDSWLDIDIPLINQLKSTVGESKLKTIDYVFSHSDETSFERWRPGNVDLSSARREVMLTLVPAAKVDNYLVIHAGYALEILDEEEAQRTLRILREIGEIDS